jgi:hypothetical protein
MILHPLIFYFYFLFFCLLKVDQALLCVHAERKTGRTPNTPETESGEVGINCACMNVFGAERDKVCSYIAERLLYFGKVV